MVDRDRLRERHDGYCPFCGLPLGADFAVHHRLLRKHGGDDSIANLIPLHHKCHNIGTRSVHLMPERSYEWGFLVHSWEEPHRTPLRLHGGSWVLINNDGTLTRQREESTHGW